MCGWHTSCGAWFQWRSSRTALVHGWDTLPLAAMRTIRTRKGVEMCCMFHLKRFKPAACFPAPRLSSRDQQKSWVNCCISAKPLTNESIDRRECFILFVQAQPNGWHACCWCQRHISKCSVVVLLVVGLTSARMRCSVTVSYVVFGSVQHAFKM